MGMERICCSHVTQYLKFLICQKSHSELLLNSIFNHLIMQMSSSSSVLLKQRIRNCLICKTSFTHTLGSSTFSILRGKPKSFFTDSYETSNDYTFCLEASCL